MMEERKYNSKHSGVHEVRRYEASGGGTEGNEVPGELLRQLSKFKTKSTMLVLHDMMYFNNLIPFRQRTESD